MDYYPKRVYLYSNFMLLNRTFYNDFILNLTALILFNFNFLNFLNLFIYLVINNNNNLAIYNKKWEIDFRAVVAKKKYTIKLKFQEMI